MIYHLGVGTTFKLIDPLKTGPSIFSKRDIFLGVTCLQRFFEALWQWSIGKETVHLPLPFHGGLNA
jgi:hypothetical protein